MIQTLPHTMTAAVLDHFGGIEKLRIQALPVPEIGPGQVLIRIEATGLGAWDVEEREGEYVAYLGAPTFPYVLGWEGAGTVVQAGSAVTRFSEGDRVYAVVFPESGGGGFCAEYAAVNADDVAPVPPSLTMEQAAAMGWDALTALAGVEGALAVAPGETLMVFGASGGVGHLALQIARRAGARVLAVASGDDGVALVRRLGADAAVDGRRHDVLAAAREFAPTGVDAAIVTTGGAAAEAALAAVRDGGRVAYPNGVTPRPQGRPGLRVVSFDGVRTEEAKERLHHMLAAGELHVHVAHAFPLTDIARAHRALAGHYVGKLVLRG
ncbi:quinone oxidoreductase family protein [Rubrivivax sp. RP6-9]|uniref:quinone oxidoreductase family protein n=1 Tax=Rubrivivax sp. RP6-9 TaxID=3415750 RepID=UPI003CC5CE50